MAGLLKVIPNALNSLTEFKKFSQCVTLYSGFPSTALGVVLTYGKTVIVSWFVSRMLLWLDSLWS